MGFSIIIPVKAINAYIHESVPIILGLDYEDFEVIILPNEASTSPEPSFLSHEKVRVIATGRVSPAVKRDIGAKESRYEFLAFIDDDAYPEASWLRRAAQIFQDQGVAAIGGPAVTPVGSSVREMASGLFYETKIGGGGMSYRYRPVKKNFFVDDYPTVNLIVRKNAFFGVGGFDSAFWPGEDTKLCHDLVKAGHRILYVSDVLVWHHRREVFKGHLRQIAGYGRHRGYFAKILPRTSRRLVYFLPSLFVLGHLGLFFLTLIDTRFGLLWAVIWVFYLGLSAMDVGLRTYNIKLFILTTITIPLSHFTYGIMFMRGFLTKQSFKSELR